MVATKVLISLCVVGLARAAPQLGVPLPLTATAASSSSLNERVIVNDVVTSLQPSIAAAVANALRSLSFSSTTSSSSNSNNFGASRNTASNFGSSSATGFASGASVSSSQQQEEEVTARPNYNYEFKVADDDKQTYISHNEARDGDDVTGTYSYVDPNGALITVNYQAGVMGYTQTLDKQEGAVSIRSNNNAASSSSSSSAANVGSSSSFGSSSSSSSFGGSSSSSSNSRNSGSSFASTASSALNESDLITRIITALQPQISSAVNSAISTQNAVTQQQTSFRGVSSNTGFAAGDRLTPLFGN